MAFNFEEGIRAGKHMDVFRLLWFLEDRLKQAESCASEKQEGTHWTKTEWRRYSRSQKAFDTRVLTRLHKLDVPLDAQDSAKFARKVQDIRKRGLALRHKLEDLVMRNKVKGFAHVGQL